MTAFCAAMLLSAVQAGDPYECRRPELREKLLERGGGSKETEAAVRKALEWLAKAQKVDRSWPSPEEDFTIGVTALSVLAFLGAGHDAKSETFGDPVRRGVQYLLAAQDKAGCIGTRGLKYMYGHILATLALAEAHAMSPSESTGKSAQKAVDFLVGAQNPGLGWRYYQKCGDNDTSVTTWAVLALHAAERAGLTFPKAAWEGALAWFDDATDESGRTEYNSRVFRGLPGADEAFEHHATNTAMASFSRFLITRKKSAGNVLLLTKDPPRTDKWAIDYCWWHFGSLAIFSLNDPAGPEWKAWNEAMKPALLKTQED
ncbi:MAG: terpene cyclase/mutase family protein, partial [Planctomycetes bacterium]|nr:terpene cyclase/mutase family protein [Planctomycetota bacterium]